MNKDNVFVNSDVIEECLSECFDVFEKVAQIQVPGKTSKVSEIAS